ncbi:MAG TPA: nuclear transport factor 2 family protein [Tepidisphaeraceae bacterium]|jgi:ketosteroid isomerase-like protein|nr:nuclear transport factor 2 family protein [Tepidisphaeraceae bacterium]
MNSIDKHVAHAIDGYISAVYTRNVEAFMALYDPAARVFDTWSTWSYESSSARHPTIQSWFSSLGDERVRVRFDEVRITALGEFACITAFVTYAAESPTGQILRSMQNRLTWVLRLNGDGGVKIIHEHTSVPIDSNLKGILNRELAGQS